MGLVGGYFDLTGTRNPNHLVRRPADLYESDEAFIYAICRVPPRAVPHLRRQLAAFHAAPVPGLHGQRPPPHGPRRGAPPALPPPFAPQPPFFPSLAPAAKPARPPRRMTRELVCKRRSHQKARRVDGGRRPAHSLPLSPPPPSSALLSPFLLTLSSCDTRATGIHRQDRRAALPRAAHDARRPLSSTSTPSNMVAEVGRRVSFGRRRTSALA